MTPKPLHDLIDFNIDRYLDPFIPRNYIYLLPTPISHFLGYRKTPPKEPPATAQWLLTVLSTMAGLLVIGAVLNYAPGIQSWKPPPMIASFGAAAILELNAMKSPFAQPRNAIVGHTLAAIIAVGVAKLTMLAPSFYENYVWIASVVSCTAVSLVMSMTNTVHPPGGATAMLAFLDKDVVALGWKFPLLILLGMVLMLGVGCLMNNTLRQFPIWWWTPEEVGSKLYRNRKLEETGSGVVEHAANERGDRSDSEHTLADSLSDKMEPTSGFAGIHITSKVIRVPSDFELSSLESDILNTLSVRLQQHVITN